MTVTTPDVRTWTTVCSFDDLLPERGVAALVDGLQVAIFRDFDGGLYAIGNQDPYTGAFVLSRGIVGSRGTAVTVASPLHKQVFDLTTGSCLDDDTLAVPVYPVRSRAGLVEISIEPTHL
jgi:nitrite reductase (NADH) small subunit